MGEVRVSAAALIGVCAAALLASSAGAAPAVGQGTTRVGDTSNVYFRALSPDGQKALRTLCAAKGGAIVANAKGQQGCQVGSINDSKNISDGAAKGQASE